jgi:tyrosine-protein kinase Etk/Wzc
MIDQNSHPLALPDRTPNLPVDHIGTIAEPTFVPYEEEIEFANIIDTLHDNRWLIILVIFSVLIFGVAYAYLAKPLYEATLLIHVEEDKPNTSKNMLGDISSIYDVKAAANSEIELLSSRMVVAKAVDNLKLSIQSKPQYFPLIGWFLASIHNDLSTPGIFGYGGYVWGNESIKISKFDVPDALMNKEFTVRALGMGRCELILKKLNIDQEIDVGVQNEIQTEYGKIDLFVDELAANAGAEFSLKRQPQLTAIQNVLDSMSISEKGKQSGVIYVTFENNDKKLAADILNEIGKEYIRQNIARKLEEAEKSLAFLDTQLPFLKEKLESSEANYNQFRVNNGTVDLSEEERLSLGESSADKAKLLELEQKRQELLVSFTPHHPAVIGIDSQIESMKAAINSIALRIKHLPIIEEELLRLSREVKVNTELYAGLLNTAQQLRLVRAGKVSNVRLVDAAMVPDKPIKPDRPKVIFLSILLGTLLAGITVFLKKALQRGVVSEKKIDQIFGSKMVYASIPHSAFQKSLKDNTNPKNKKLPLLASYFPEDMAIESLRAFRTAFQNTLNNMKNNIVVITSPTPGVGKSFVSANFSTVMASSGKRVLLIDADFRNGYLHKYFGIERENGLSNCILGRLPMQEAIRRNVEKNLDFLPTGDLPEYPSEFLLHQRFNEILQQLSTEYDLVVIDQPPLIAVSDTLIIGMQAGALFLLIRAGITTEDDLNESIRRLKQAGIALTGVLINDMKIRNRQYHAYYYRKEKPSLSFWT